MAGRVYVGCKQSHLPETRGRTGTDEGGRFVVGVDRHFSFDVHFGVVYGIWKKIVC